MKSKTKTEDTYEQGQALYHRAVAKTKEGAKAADKMVHRHAYNVLAAGILLGFVTGLLVSRSGRCCAPTNDSML
jgi:ElaB/YqjD/DUF883 family membrane-anchored ribosome-binding protein